MFFAVVTTIQDLTPSLCLLERSVSEVGGVLLVAGDAKGPRQFNGGKGTTLLTLHDQRQSGFSLAALLPVNHYGRKNVAYLEAFRRGATLVYETDDDNAPKSCWRMRSLTTEALPIAADGWVNVYRFFSRDNIWPRGFVLDELQRGLPGPWPLDATMRAVEAPVQQGLADNSPDVDAIWRLTMDRPFVFDERPSVHLPPGAWCPFNSQSTWWWPEAYPLMYLPSYCSFRMTDIWRSFVAQRCLWELGYGVVFHAPEVVQDRNPHNLMRDFADEIPGYLRNREIAEILERLSLRSGTTEVGKNLRICYETLVERDVFPSTELALVDAWLKDLVTVGRVNALRGACSEDD